MPKAGTESRQEILDAAERLFLSQGYGGTSLDAILEQTGFTKGAFFHHFSSKHDLAHALIERYAARDQEQLDLHLARARRLSRDPLQQVLILVGLYEESMESLTEPYPGCLFAAYCYQAGLFDERVHAIIRASMQEWRDVLGERLRAAMAQHTPRITVAPADLADAAVALMEGAFIVSKTLLEPQLVARQLRQYRNYLELLFAVA